MNKEELERRCPQCSSTAIETISGIKNLDLHSCQDCGEEWESIANSCPCKNINVENHSDGTASCKGDCDESQS